MLKEKLPRILKSGIYEKFLIKELSNMSTRHSVTNTKRSNSNIWSPTTASKRSMAKRRKRSSTDNLSKFSDNIKINYVPKLRNRKEIFAYFFNALIKDFIQSRESTVKLVDIGPSSNTSIKEVIEKDFKHVVPEDLENATITGATGENIFIEKTSSPLFKFTPTLKPQHDAISKLTPEKIYKITDLEHSPSKLSQDAVSDMATDDTNMKEILYIERIVFKNGNVYEGTTNDYLMNGKGKFTWTDKTVYLGEFKDGYITGKGEMILPDLSRYEGSFCQGTFHGNGFLNLIGTSLYYYGNWNNGKKHGKGWVLYEPGDWYDGEWNNDLRHGVGYRRYKNGSKYKGDWVEHKKHGKGKLLLYNNDYYSGEWRDDKPNGYGEYTWDLKYNEAFCFPLYNSYKGTWKNGERHGLGIMEFGTESGAKYAGMWYQNYKHGPGVMICGNGLVLESNPLFEYNKPVHKSAVKSVEELQVDTGSTPNELITDLSENEGRGSYYDILNIINSKIACEELDRNIVIKITKNSENIPHNRFVKLLDTISGSKKEWCPLEIPTQIVPRLVDFTYFIDEVFNYAAKHSQIDDFSSVVQTLEAEAQAPARFRRSLLSVAYRYSTNTLTHRAKTLKVSLPIFTPERKESPIMTEEKLSALKEEEAELLKNIVIRSLPNLLKTYKKYAAICRTNNGNGDELPYACVLIRLFLWQLFRDAHIQDGVQLAEVDSFLWSNPQSCLETEHYPFEPIYFYQFLLYLMGCAWLTNLKTLEKNPESKMILPSKIFKNFLDKFFGRIDTFKGGALGEHLNLVPIKKMYNLYASISTPMSVKTFLSATYRHEKEQIPCFAEISSGSITNIINGFNVVPIEHEISYVEIPEPLVADIDLKSDKVVNPDAFSRSLLTFRTLGKRKIFEFLLKICPKIMNENKQLDLNYNLTFLEFYEVILLCAFAKADELVKDHESKKYCSAIHFGSLENLIESSVKLKGKKKRSKKSALAIQSTGHI